MKTVSKIGALSAWVCAATYLVSIALFASRLAFFDDAQLGFEAFMAAYFDNQALVFVWHLGMYLINGAFLVLLALALYDRLKPAAPDVARAAAAFGLIWAVLVFASGLITLAGWDAIAALYPNDPAQAGQLRRVVETITAGLDHSDRFLGGLWVLLTSFLALRAGGLPRGLNVLGLLIGLPGVVSTVLPATSDLGVAFGLGIIVWWLWLGVVLWRGNPAALRQAVPAPASLPGRE